MKILRLSKIGPEVQDGLLHSSLHALFSLNSNFKIIIKIGMRNKTVEPSINETGIQGAHVIETKFANKAEMEMH